MSCDRVPGRESVSRDAPRGGSVLLVSHGGPVSNLYAELAGRRSPPCGYCALYCFERATARPGGWEARLVANQEHLARVPEAALGGPNDFAEQDGE